MAKKSGNGTELISLYIPVSKRVDDIVNRLRSEHSSCGNIKSKQTRTNVQRALSTIIKRLQGTRSVPENGLIIFCGTIVQERGDRTEFEYRALTPPSPIQSFSYTCGAKFVTDAATDLAAQKDVYALLVMDLQESCWGLIEGSAIKVLGSYDSIVPNKHSQGGQSSVRFERLRDITINEYFVKLSDRITNAFLSRELKGFLIGGCGMTKDDFVRGEYLHHELRKMIIGTFDTSDTNERGLYELVEASKSKLSDLSLTHEKEIFDTFLRSLAKNDGAVAYGFDNIVEKTKNGQVKQLIISTSKMNLYEQFETNNTTNYKIEVISKDSESGTMLDKAFNGIVAILRYAE